MMDFLAESFRTDCLAFLRSMCADKSNGFYRYSFSGDIPDERTHWGLGNTVFAAKAFYMLDALTVRDCDEMAGFISSFQRRDGYISDPYIERKSCFRRLIIAGRTLDFNNIANAQTKRAETRQAFAALRCLGKKPEAPFLQIPYREEKIKEYVHSLNWRQPWGAASHISHIVFFLHHNRVFLGVNKERADELIELVFKEANTYRRDDGSWYAEGVELSPSHRVNAGMKMMTAYAAAERNDFELPEKLIDLSLASANTGDACSNFNIICVLYYCSRKTDYRFSEIKQYCLERLNIYKRHYWPEHGGFSFYERKANDVYYGAKVSKGLSEPDIHGTVLFLWGISLISEILNIPNGVKFKLPIT